MSDDDKLIAYRECEKIAWDAMGKDNQAGRIIGGIRGLIRSAEARIQQESEE